MTLAIGTSGFSYPEWKGSLYPAGLPARLFLNHYASKLDAVEIDSTFYGLPTEKTLRAWLAATPEGFRFAIKAPGKITHRERLRVPSSTLGELHQLLPALSSRLGVVLYQLPPFEQYDLGKLSSFLEVLPTSIKAAFEFRHVSWFRVETYRLLEKHGVAFCINDNRDFACPIEVTAGHTYVRLRQDKYGPKARALWCERLLSLHGRGIDVVAFVKHKDNPRAPLVALDFKKALRRALSLAVTPALAGGRTDP
jgi:uncharacterized protein YecE (DUF72 family)